MCMDFSFWTPLPARTRQNGRRASFFATDPGKPPCLFLTDKPEAPLIVRVCLAIARADGNIDITEQQVLGQICHSLGLELKDFS